MSRTLFTVALLLLAATAQGMSPARQGANGGGGTCPEAQAQVADATDPAAPAASADVGVPTPAAASVATPKAPAANRGRAGARWHSFVPGMFK